MILYKSENLCPHISHHLIFPCLSLSLSDCEVDPKLMGSQLLLSTLLQNTVSGSGGPAGLILQSDGPYDFYRDPNMSQARICLPALEQLSKALRQRLSDWPEHPALVQVREAVTVTVIAMICFRFF